MDRRLGIGVLLGFFCTVACQEKPAELRIKGPLNSLESQYDIQKLPEFEKAGQTLQLRASAYDDQGRFMGPAEVDWSTTDRTVATISRTGLLTVLSSGVADVVARTEGEPTLEARMQVEASIVDGIRITKPEVKKGRRPKLPMGEFMQFEAEVLNDRGEVIEDHPITWESTTYAAIVRPGGKVEGGAIGTTQIVATAKGTSHSDALEIEVTDWPKGRRR
jgi:hypothetical protein